MFATLRRAASRKGLTAGLAALVATAGIGVAVAAPSDAPHDPVVPSALAVGASEGIDETVDDAAFELHRQVDAPEAPPVVDVPEEAGQDPAPSPSAPAGVERAADSTPEVPPVDPRQFLPEGNSFDSDVLKGFLPAGVDAGEVPEGAEELADEVIARIQACVGDVVAQFGSGFDFDGSTGSGGSAGAGQSFATSIVEDVLPCAAGLVEDTVRCVSGLVEEILSTVMGMDVDEIAGLAGVIVDALVDCVGGAQTD